MTLLSYSEIYQNENEKEKRIITVVTIISSDLAAMTAKQHRCMEIVTRRTLSLQEWRPSSPADPTGVLWGSGLGIWRATAAPQSRG